MGSGADGNAMTGITEHANEAAPRPGVLDWTAKSVTALTPFRRVMIMTSLAPKDGAASSSPHVSVHGLEHDEEHQVRTLVCAELRSAELPLPDENTPFGCHFYRAGNRPTCLNAWPASRRLYLGQGGWQSGDLIVAPLRADRHLCGWIVADDPRDGAVPGPDVLRRLSVLAQLAARCALAASTLPGEPRSELFQLLAEHCLAGLLLTQGGHLRYVNRRVLELLGYTREELLAMQPWWQIIHPEDRAPLLKEGTTDRAVRARATRKDMSSVWLLVRSFPLGIPDENAHLVDLWDISEQVEMEGMLRAKALHDPLTGLFNRHYFEEAIQAEVHRAQRYSRTFSLMMTDMRGFKRVNDQLGHTKGDEVLASIAREVKGALRESDWVVRYGGDEFLIVLPETPAPADAVAERLRRCVETWAAEHLPDIALTMDVGWATWSPENPRTIPALLQAADSMLYERKKEASGN